MTLQQFVKNVNLLSRLSEMLLQTQLHGAVKDVSVRVEDEGCMRIELTYAAPTKDDLPKNP